MKQMVRPNLYKIVLLIVVCSLLTACQPISSAVTPVAINSAHAALTETATLPQETPAAAPTEIVSWPLSPDQRLMVAQSSDGAWWMWDLSSHKAAYLLNDTALHAPPIHRPIFSADGRFLAAISIGHVLLWEVATRKRRMLMPPMSIDHRSLRSLVFSPDSRFLASNGCQQQNNHMVCYGGLINLWNTSEGTLERTFTVGFRVDDMVFSGDGSTLTASGCSITDGVIGSYCYEKSKAIYNIDNGELIALTRVPQFQ